SAAAHAPRVAMRRPRLRAAWLGIFVVRCSLPCDPPVGGHSCEWRDDTTPRAYGHFDEAWVKPASSRVKIHAVVDSSGLPVRLALTTGEAHDNRLAAALLSRLRSGSMLLADRGYDADWIRAFVQSRKAHGRMRAAAEKRCLVLARRSRNSNC